MCRTGSIPWPTNNLSCLAPGISRRVPVHTDWLQDISPFTARLNDIRKYVVSTTLDEPLPWKNSILIKDDVPRALEKLKAEQDKDAVVFGSGLLVQSLMRWKLMDELTLLIHPLILGSGRRLFPSGGVSAVLQLRNAKTTSNGVVIATYQPANPQPPPLR
ncbi:dihydrofolate reductase family protein [Acidithiobacillus ferrianus]|uniref:Bacterial bifunctional deaminase-reductase C-terminal domain-containing protein n=1 Tax=Acidithiobacillus ferrianus TaxID=2678518 RepID=A0A845UFL2_9PROT|nr:hypothetical protein [Acidithiobacillus ferrianus]